MSRFTREIGVIGAWGTRTNPLPRTWNSEPGRPSHLGDWSDQKSIEGRGGGREIQRSV